MKKIRHECPDWDFLMIEPDSPECSCCNCEFEIEPIQINTITSKKRKGTFRNIYGTRKAKCPRCNTYPWLTEKIDNLIYRYTCKCTNVWTEEFKP